jgi:hypothetical protein
MRSLLYAAEPFELRGYRYAHRRPIQYAPGKNSVIVLTRPMRRPVNDLLLYLGFVRKRPSPALSRGKSLTALFPSI